MDDPDLRDEEEFDDHAAAAVWRGTADATEPGHEAIAPWLTGRHEDHRGPVGDRARRRAIDAAADPAHAKHNWQPIGPRNVAGRVRALAVTPGRNTTWWAGTASGGLYRSIDKGLHWERLWTDQPSLSIGAIAVAAGASPDADRVYVATGEIFGIPGQGIFVSATPSDPSTWVQGSPAPGASNHLGGFDAIAIDPLDEQHVWAVGPVGAFRTINGGTDWVNLDPDHAWADVHFASDGRLFLARAGAVDDGSGTIDGRAVVLPLTNADALAPIPDLTTLANMSNILPGVAAGAGSWPAGIKFALAPSDETIAFARVVDEQNRHVGIFRTRNFGAAPAAIVWERLADNDDFHTERQGLYNLCIAVHPSDPNFVATGMVDIHITRNAHQTTTAPIDDVHADAVVFHRAMSWGLNAGDRAHHADQHQLVAIDDTPPPGGPTGDGQLWAAHDDGVSMCANWETATAVSSRHPLTHTSFLWESRDDGISASQLYDINQSPLLPAVVAAGFQDNGTHMGAVGQTWRNIFGGDGGFASFDPDDPYAMTVTTQSGIARVNFPGHHDAGFPDEQPPGPSPRGRRLPHGFKSYDSPLFVADTVRHPTDRSRSLHARSGRLYGTRTATGEQWQVEPLGRSLDLRVERDAVATPRLRVTLASTRGAHQLGLVPGVTVGERDDDPEVDRPPPPNVAPLVSHLPAPFALKNGDQVRLTVDGDAADHVITFATGDFVDIGAATLAEVIAKFEAAAIPGLVALPRLWSTPTSVEIRTTNAGTGRSITLGGTAMSNVGAGLHDLSRLGVGAGTYSGADDLPATVTLGALATRRSDQLVGRDFPAANSSLEISIDGGPKRTITLGPPTMIDPTWITAGELAAAIATALENDPVDVIACTRIAYVSIEAEPGRTVSVTGTAAAKLGIRPLPRRGIDLLSDFHLDYHLGRHRRNRFSFDMRPDVPGTPLELDIFDGTNTATVRFDGTGSANLRSVTAPELYNSVRAALGAAAPALAAEATLSSYIARGAASEMTWSSTDTGRVWVGRSDGLVSRSDDAGATWTELGAGELDLADARVEAIALHPYSTEIAYVGHWSPLDLKARHRFLHRTDDGGLTWTPCDITIVAGPHNAAIRSLEVFVEGPNQPETIYAATDHGIFWTVYDPAAAQQDWRPFSEGLPHCQVIDLALEHSVDRGPYLVAATWGAGGFRRSIGKEPPDDIRLHVRTNELDTGDRGASRPAPPDPFAVAAGGDRAASPDIKITRLGANPAPTDGVRFDLDVGNDAAVIGREFDVLVQVHNRGSQAARSTTTAGDPNVRIVVLGVALATSGQTPAALASDTWTKLAAGPLAAGTALGNWHVLDDRPLPQPLLADTPAVVHVSVPSGATPLTAPRFATLVLVTATDDELTDGPLDIDDLVRSERRCAYREVDVLRPDQDTRLVLRSTSGRDIEVVTADAADSPAAGALNLGGGASTRVVAATAAPGTTHYDLTAADPWITIHEQLSPVSITFDNAHGEFRDLSAARPAEVVDYVARRFDAAGLPLRSLTDEVEVRLRALGDAQMEVTGGAAHAPGLLQFAPAGPQPAITSPIPSPLNIPADAKLDVAVTAHDAAIPPPGPRVSTRSVSLAVDNDRGWQLADMINRGLRDAGLDGLVVAESPIDWLLLGAGSNEHRVTFDLAGSAADLALLGLAAAADAGFATSALGVVDLTSNPTITFTPRHRVRVRFRRNPAAETPPLQPSLATEPSFVRRTINDMMETTGMGVRAEAAVTRLKIGHSSSDRGPGAPIVGSADLAEIATSGGAPAATPNDLFDIRLAPGIDQLAAGLNHVYVRGRNDGNVATTNGRWRLYTIDIGDPIVTATISPLVAHTEDLDPTSRVTADLTYTRVAAGGGVEFVMAVLDEDIADGRLDPPASWPTVDDFLAWIDAHDNASVRRFDAAP